MSIDVTGKNVKLWKNERQGNNGNHWFEYSIGVSKKNKYGKYTNGYVRVKFGRDVVDPSEVPNGSNMNFSGYLTLDVYTNKQGEEVKRDMIMITEASFPDLALDDIPDSFAQADDDIPF